MDQETVERVKKIATAQVKAFLGAPEGKAMVRAAAGIKTKKKKETADSKKKGAAETR